MATGGSCCFSTCGGVSSFFFCCCCCWSFGAIRSAQLSMSWPLDWTAHVAPERESLSTTRLPLDRRASFIPDDVPDSAMMVPVGPSPEHARHARPPVQAAYSHPPTDSGRV